jgi:hypothetical protein
MVPFARADVNARRIYVEALGVCRSSTPKIERCEACKKPDAEKGFRDRAHIYLHGSVFKQRCRATRSSLKQFVKAMWLPMTVAQPAQRYAPAPRVNEPGKRRVAGRSASRTGGEAVAGFSETGGDPALLMVGVLAGGCRGADFTGSGSPGQQMTRGL